MKENFRVKSTETVYRSRLFDVEKRQVEFPQGERDYYVVTHPGAVVILPLLNDDTLVLVKQYRIAVDEELLEFPAGLLEKGEDPIECGKRELAEEASFRADSWKALGNIYPAPGFCNELQHVYLARDLSPYSLPQDDDEILEVVKMTQSEFITAIQNGQIKDAKTLAAYAMFVSSRSSF